MILDNRTVYNIYCRLVLHNPKLRVFLTNLLVPDEDVQGNLFGSNVTFNKRREIGMWRTLDVAQHNAIIRDEIGPLLSLALLMQPGDTFVDIGANVGLYSSTFARYTNFTSAVKFYAFEANPDTAKRLRSSLEQTNVQIFDVALSDREGTTTFFEGTTSGVFTESSHACRFTLTDRKHEIATKRLDDFAIEGDSLILKIDVEGHERAVLDGASSLLAAKRIKAVFLDGFEDASIPEYLKTFGFRPFDATNMTPAQEPLPRQLLLINEKFLSSGK